ncbi:hypothetical protein V5O48_013209 [Marasmius crinis-equi]|uniref:Enoyl reductase (ER) domain-containing protein n=1 Tax=Marasmius crinis-equi TaxID=585013 RepID=A0ABR3F152_9AGAR
MSQEQKALVLPAPSTPYTIISKSIPVPGDDEVLVKLQGIALNPAEWLLPAIPVFLEGLTYPIYTGSDGAGVVEAVGKEAEAMGWKKGDRVLTQGWMSADYSTYQQYALAPARLVSKLPTSLPALEASSIPLTLGTAAFAFCLPDPVHPSPTKAAENYNNPVFFGSRSGAGIKPFWEAGAKGLMSGEPIVVFGGSSSVGQFAIQIAAHYGFSPIIATSSAKHTDFLKSLGATHVLDREASVDEIKEILQNTSIKHYFVAVMGALTQAHVDLLSPSGTVISVVPVNRPGMGPEIKFEDGKRATNVNGATHGYKEFGYGLMGALGGLLEKGVIKPNRVEKLPGGLSGITDGLERLKKGEVSGVKLVVDPTETA